MLYTLLEIIAADSGTHTKHLDTMFGEIMQCLYMMASDTYNTHSLMKVSKCWKIHPIKYLQKGENRLEN
jgi:hypothetical protein